MNNTGLPGVTLDDRDHVCVLYRGPAERDSVLGAFFDAGHAEGDKCLCIADDQDPAAVAARLDPEHHRGPDQLTVLPATAYLTDGRFEPQQVYEQWNSVTERYVDDGYRHVRGAGHTIGLGRARTGADGAARSYAEARRSADFAERLGRPVLRHEELGLSSLLADGGDPEAMAGFVDEWLGPLVAHDERRSQKLLPTLAAYLDAGAAQQATADALGIHVSTLKYRLGRIEAVTGRSLSQPDVRFQLQVALTVQHTLTVLLGKREP